MRWIFNPKKHQSPLPKSHQGNLEDSIVPLLPHGSTEENKPIFKLLHLARNNSYATKTKFVKPGYCWGKSKLKLIKEAFSAAYVVSQFRLLVLVKINWKTCKFRTTKSNLLSSAKNGSTCSMQNDNLKNRPLIKPSSFSKWSDLVRTSTAKMNSIG